jgi:hypothetical protein
LTHLRLRRTADVQKQRLRQPPTTVSPSSSEEGSHKFPSLDKEGLGSGRFLARSFFFIDILALFPKKHLSSISFQLAAVPFPDGADPALWVCDVPKGQIRPDGTICPPGPLGRAHARF